MKGLRKRQLNRRFGGLAAGLGILICASAFSEPELKVIPQEGPAHLNRVYRIVCEVAWTGGASEYAILPAQADAIDWGTVSVGDVRGFVRNDADGDHNVVSQTLAILPNKKGEFKSPEIRISYLTPEATPPAEKPAPGTAPSDSGASPSLRADPFTISVRPDITPIWIFGGLGASLLLLTALGWRFARLRRKPQPSLDSSSGAAGSAISAVQEALHQARQRRLDGNFYQFYTELARAAESLPESERSSEWLHALKSRAQEVGYRGARPTDDQMDGDLRDVERAWMRLKETDSP